MDYRLFLDNKSVREIFNFMCLLEDNMKNGTIKLNYDDGLFDHLDGIASCAREVKRLVLINQK